MMVALLSGGLDLSTLSTANHAALPTTARLKMAPATWAEPQFYHRGRRDPAGFGIAAVIGPINDALIGCLRVSPLFAASGGMTLIKGLAVGRPAAGRKSFSRTP